MYSIIIELFKLFVYNAVNTLYIYIILHCIRFVTLVG